MIEAGSVLLGYVTGRLLGSGTFGEVYLAENNETHEFVAVKLEPISSNHSQLFNEKKDYTRLNGCVGIPRVHWYGKEGDFNVLIIDLLGSSIQQLFVEQKKKFIIAEGTLTYIVEDKYSSWADFEKEISVLLQKCEPILINCIVNRLSIRFINQFVFENFDDPTEYFKTLISSSEDQVSIPYPLIKYGFKLTLDVKENTYAIVNQNLDRVRDKYVYIFDIDVLNRTDLMFENATIVSVIQELREIKNNIFFSNITEKLIALCN